MIFRDKHERSIIPKIFIVTALLSSIIVSFQLMFVEKADLVAVLQPYKIDGHPWRNYLLLFSFVLYFFQLIFTLFIFHRLILQEKAAFVSEDTFDGMQHKIAEIWDSIF